MISARKLLKLAKKCQKMAAIKRKRITLPQHIATTAESRCRTSTKPEKGCFVVYSADQKRFLLPLEYLNSEIIRELFNMAEEEFGLPREGPLTLLCEAELLEYAISLIKQQITRDTEQALLISIASNCCLSSFHLQHQATIYQLPICSF